MRLKCGKYLRRHSVFGLHGFSTKTAKCQGLPRSVQVDRAMMARGSAVPHACWIATRAAFHAHSYTVPSGPWILLEVCGTRPQRRHQGRNLDKTKHHAIARHSLLAARWTSVFWTNLPAHPKNPPTLEPRRAPLGSVDPPDLLALPDLCLEV